MRGLEPIRVEFCPIPITDTVEIVTVGKLTGVLIWHYGTGDALVRVENGVWYVPQGSWKKTSSTNLKEVADA